MKPCTQPKRYQDVKVTLRWWTAVVLPLTGFLFYYYVIPGAQRATFSGALPFAILDRALVFLVCEFLAYLLVFLLEIHDKVYDRYFTKWRHYYDIDFIIPKLVRPFAHKLDTRFFDFCQSNVYQFMKVYYHFVGDGEREHKINENLITRFYEAVTKYWITQINEILLFLYMILTFICHFFIYKRLALPPYTIVNAIFVIIILFIINRIFVAVTRSAVRQATADEIEDIHERYVDQLDQELKNLHEKTGMRYEQNQD